MFNRVDAGLDCRFNTVSAMGMGRNAQAPLVGFFCYHTQFAFRKLLLPGLCIAGKHAASGTHLDDFRAIFALTAHLITQFVFAIGNALFLAGFFKAWW